MVDLDAVRLGSEQEKLAYVPLMHNEIKGLREEIERVWEELDDIERACSQSDDADATLNSIEARIQRLRKELNHE